jgi:hypothetical protein
MSHSLDISYWDISDSICLSAGVNVSTRIDISASLDIFCISAVNLLSLRHNRVLSIHSKNVDGFVHDIRPLEAMTRPPTYSVTNTLSRVVVYADISVEKSDNTGIRFSERYMDRVVRTIFCIFLIFQDIYNVVYTKIYEKQGGM